jgi:branched-chain amino acid transport system ATP-binding protein
LGKNDENILELIDVHTYYGESHVLHGISLRLAKGSIVGLVGRNGMGKTTTINSIIGFNPPRNGQILLNSKNIATKPPYEIARLGIGIVPQGRRLFYSLTVKENLVFGARRGFGGKAWTLDEVFQLFPVLSKKIGAFSNQLSGGEQQMLAIGRALMTNPRLLLIDELTEGLAPLIIQELGRVVNELKESSQSILLIEQNLSFALQFTDYIYAINKGIIIFQSYPKQISSQEEFKELLFGT